MFSFYMYISASTSLIHSSHGNHLKSKPVCFFPPWVWLFFCFNFCFYPEQWFIVWTCQSASSLEITLLQSLCRCVASWCAMLCFVFLAWLNCSAFAHCVCVFCEGFTHCVTVSIRWSGPRTSPKEKREIQARINWTDGWTTAK